MPTTAQDGGADPTLPARLVQHPRDTLEFAQRRLSAWNSAKASIVAQYALSARRALCHSRPEIRPPPIAACAITLGAQATTVSPLALHPFGACAHSRVRSRAHDPPLLACLPRAVQLRELGVHARRVGGLRGAFRAVVPVCAAHGRATPPPSALSMACKCNRTANWLTCSDSLRTSREASCYLTNSIRRTHS
jgi:hypothetical protein